MTLIEKHLKNSARLIRQADEELQKGDGVQASEKAWGSVVHRLKAIARDREWDHGGHYDLSVIVERLADETNQSEMEGLFSIAESLHANFYNDWKSERMIRSNIVDVKTLLSKLEEIEIEANGLDGQVHDDC